MPHYYIVQLFHCKIAKIIRFDMRILLRKLKKYIVETESGVKLGKVSDLILDIDDHSVVQYVVRPAFFSSKEYLIGHQQIVRFEDSKIIVEDTIAKVGIKQKSKATASPEPVMMRKET